MMKINNIFAKAMMNGVISWIAIALITALRHTDATFAQALVSPNTIIIAVTCAAASYVGYMIRTEKG